MNVVTSAQMKQLEQAALQYDLTFHRLMENAGSAAAAFIRRTFKLAGLNCIVFCGTGNNGGDGFVVARKMLEDQANVIIVLVGGKPKTENANAMYSVAQLMDIPILDIEHEQDKILSHLQHTDIIVDAIYGTGFHGELNETATVACRAINDAIAAIVALDVPSGLACDSGEGDPNTVKADFTVVFDSLKPLHIMPEAKLYCGEIEVVDIGIPPQAREAIAQTYTVLQTETVWEHLPVRDPLSHKGTHGHLLSVCGSAFYRGAAALSTLAAFRSGVGLVTLASTEIVCSTVASAIHEAIFLPLQETTIGTISAEHACKALQKPLQHATAILFGCGCGDQEDTQKILHFLLQNAKCPIVIDADGINALAKNIHVLKDASVPVIVTPHPGEMSRLCGKPVQELLQDRYATASNFAKEQNVILLLKGSETVIASPDGQVLLNRTGNAGLAKAGSGDLLAGMIAAFVAQGISPLMAAGCGAHLHGLAADRCADRRSQYGMLPSELLNDLTVLFAENGR